MKSDDHFSAFLQLAETFDLKVEVQKKSFLFGKKEVYSIQDPGLNIEYRTIRGGADAAANSVFHLSFKMKVQGRSSFEFKKQRVFFYRKRKCWYKHTVNGQSNLFDQIEFQLNNNADWGTLEKMEILCANDQTLKFELGNSNEIPNSIFEFLFALIQQEKITTVSS